MAGRGKAATAEEAEHEKRIGGRLRTARLEAGWSQERLGHGLGITFQQVQKYERGTDRIACSRLYRAAALLNKPITYFFETLAKGRKPMQTVENPWASHLMKDVSAIREPKLQKLVATVIHMALQMQTPEASPRRAAGAATKDECMC